MRIYTTCHHMVSIPRGKSFSGLAEFADPPADPGVRVVWLGFSYRIGFSRKNHYIDTDYSISELDPLAPVFLKGRESEPLPSMTEAQAIEYLQTGKIE